MGLSEETMWQVHLKMNEASQPISCESHLNTMGRLRSVFSAALKTQADNDWHCTLFPLLVDAMSHEVSGSGDN